MGQYVQYQNSETEQQNSITFHFIIYACAFSTVMQKCEKDLCSIITTVGLEFYMMAFEMLKWLMVNVKMAKDSQLSFHGK